MATTSAGTYRRIIAKVKDMTYDIVNSQDNQEDLFSTNQPTENDPKPVISAESDKPITKAIRLKFTLGCSNYATMFLRELTKSK